MADGTPSQRVVTRLGRNDVKDISRRISVGDIPLRRVGILRCGREDIKMINWLDVMSPTLGKQQTHHQANHHSEDAFDVSIM
jgi:hypothetical protein